MNQPSSTITAAFLAGTTTSLLWALWSWLGTAVPPPEVVSLSTTLVASLVGYLKPERVYEFTKREKPE
ncbi:hypothetical protein FBQ88_12425 [Gammaproteobacteria bacterium PRO2]|nr:hypothetical protein [Gammaproteobacteria bacterium PRO2]